MFVKFDRDGNRLWATYYGGSGNDWLGGLAIDPSNNVYLLGCTSSDSGIATPGRHKDTLAKPLWRYDHFLIKSLPDSVVYLQPPIDTIICVNSKGGPVRVNYIASRSFRQDNVFKVELSDSTGSFNAPVVIGVKASTASGYVDCVAPVTMLRRKGYRIRVVASAPYYISNDNGIDIDIRNSPEKPVASGDTMLCEGDTLYLYAVCATAGVDFKWTGPNKYKTTKANSIRTFLKIADAGNYIVTASLYGCSISDTISVDVSAYPSRPYITHNTPVCEADTLRFSHDTDAVNDVVYTWKIPTDAFKPQQDNVVPAVTADFAGWYLAVASRKGCEVKDSAFIYIKPLPDIMAGSNSPVEEGDDLKLTAVSDSAKSFGWFGPDGYRSADRYAVVLNVTAVNAGMYTVIGSSNGCSDSAKVVVQVNMLEDGYFVLFPNPNDGRFTIKGSLKFEQQIQLAITNAIGQEIYNSNINADKKLLNEEIVLPAIANGIYNLRLRINGGNKIIPFIVNKEGR